MLDDHIAFYYMNLLHKYTTLAHAINTCTTSAMHFKQLEKGTCNLNWKTQLSGNMFMMLSYWKNNFQEQSATIQ